MKTIGLLGILLASVNAFAGGRTIYCNGKSVQMSVQAKGSHPYPHDADLYFSLDGKVEKAKLILRIGHSGSYDFESIYQTREPESGLVAILQDIGAKDLNFTVFRNGELIEKVTCKLGF